MSPTLGTLVNGFYTAPASYSSETQVTISATSYADPTKVGTATVLLGQPITSPTPTVSNITISVQPTSSTLMAGQSAQFEASVSGTTNTSVTWSLTPNLGTLSNGFYTAPANVTSQETVTLTATSVANPSKTATVSLVLKPVATPTLAQAVSLSISPGSVSLNGGQSTTFTPTVGGTSNTAVTWSWSPQVGTLNNGVYQAPAIIASQQTVTVTATSAADSTKTASATITLIPVAVTVGPASISLGPGKSATFTVSVTGTYNTSVTWYTPAVGTLVNGVYTAPASISAAMNVTLTAVSVADKTKTASATVMLTPSSTTSNPTTPTPAPSQTSGNPPSSTSSTIVTLPVEVIGPNGTMATASVTIPAGSNLSGQLQLAMTLHGLRSDSQASVEVNNSAWLPISTANVTLLGNAAAYGGIGGGFHTLQMTMNLPAGAVTTGTNTITFRFNQTDGRVSGFRVLAFNIQAADGSLLIPASTFVQEDPNTWTPPSTLASDISAGQTLWRTAPLTVPTSSGPSPIKAHCMDCHAQDGRDLKYFNYSNNSIVARSLFHGLTSAQGNQIASYIRSLNLPNPGRPWNPPYQPTAGLDSQPVDQWSAGGGLSAVLATDQDLVNELFPGGAQASEFSPAGVLDIRETAVPLQLPDWNSWLPIIHPMDAWPDFLTAEVNLRYSQIRSVLSPGSAASYVAAAGDFMEWGGDYNTFMVPKEVPAASAWTPAYVNQLYSVPLWAMVKNWELNQEFQLEGMAQAVFTNPKAEPRAWLTEFAFLASPNILHIPPATPGLDNGSLQTWHYLSSIWYQVQLVLNNSEYQQTGNSPLDWGYVYAMLDALSYTDSPAQAGLLNLWMIKGLQISNNGIGPQQTGTGWNWYVADLSRQASPSERSVWAGTDSSTRTAISNGIVQGWLTEVQQFTPQQFYAGGFSATRLPIALEPDSSNFEDRVWYMIPQLHYFGVNQNLINQLANWAQSIWPLANWAATTTATCAPSTGDPTVIFCTTDYFTNTAQ